MPQTPLIELRHRGGFIVSEAPGHQSIDEGTILNTTGAALIVQAGTVLSKQPPANAAPPIWAPTVRAGVVGALTGATVTAPGAGFQSVPAASAASGQGGNFPVSMMAVAAVLAAGAVTASYAPGDRVTLAGGTAAQPTVLGVQTTQLAAIGSITPGTGFAPGDTLAPAGGVQSTPLQLTVASTKVVSAAIVSPGTGGTAGAQTVTGTTGAGTKFQASVTIAGGAITAVNSISLGGAYTANPTNLANEPVTGGGVNGAVL